MNARQAIYDSGCENVCCEISEICFERKTINITFDHSCSVTVQIGYISVNLSAVVELNELNDIVPMLSS